MIKRLSRLIVVCLVFIIGFLVGWRLEGYHYTKFDENDDLVIADEIRGLPEYIGDGETDMFVRHRQGRMLAKISDRGVLVSGYGSMLNSPSSNPQVIIVLDKSGSSSQKYIDLIKDVIFDNQVYDLKIQLTQSDKLKDILNIPDQLNKFIYSEVQYTSSGLGFPKTIFLDEKGRLYDIGGIVHPKRIVQLVHDRPKFPN